ncbi:hypothetical protein ABIC99_002574 [Sphaerotilus sulfidivorans]|jgi:hypothetical protein|uniref:Uncharacterized protein n=1 Tax=Sphaerotilus sulfidivorans TaxID=639200 RepID=A0A5C1PW70_9BURK|nr:MULTISPECIES: hypothetical protein [Sphaerotilus]MBP6780466.1 hypothetical protein [Ottowia sp.]NZD46111.1 hypothetical protein [Sphaerotilus sulfidivorans]QEM99410.1 hypothetical protein EWH46_00585 [Sphaerotilus sulfidivorans]GKQ57637.1 hypothetical protein QMTAC487_14960 [Sphaerotilus sp. FB-3]
MNAHAEARTEFLLKADAAHQAPSFSDMRRAPSSELGYEAALPFLPFLSCGDAPGLPSAPLLDGWFTA